MGTEGCLDDEVIVAFAEARLSVGAASSAAAHVRQCAACSDAVSQTISSLAPSATLATVGLGPASGGESETQARERRRSRRGPSGPSLEAGVSIGRYTVMGLVGRGGMGEVYAAYDPDLDRKIALKVLLADASVDDRLAQERLLREAQAIAKLSHPNVVVVHDIGTFRGKVFVAMEFVEGATLAAWLREAPRSWRDIVVAFVAAARGLAAAHRAGIVHRDFKPQNVMITADGAVRVMDFGLARRIADDGVDARGASRPAASDAAQVTLTQTGDQVGTPLYMAPEQFAGGVIDARSDQFSFCVALHWALWGKHPFGAGSVSHGEAASPPPSAAAPAWLRVVIERGLALNPEARWPSMDAIIAAIQRDPARRRRVFGLVAAGVGACIALGVAGARLADGRRAVCGGGAARLAGVWELGESGTRPGSRREQVRAAIEKVGGANATEIWRRVASILDARASAWLGAYREACEATNVRHEQSAEVLDLRMSCLNDSLDATRALTELLAGGDPKVVANATNAATPLSDFERCADVPRLRAGIQPPKDPLLRARAEVVRKRLRDVRARFDAGDASGARQGALEMLTEAKRLDYRPLEAEALLLKANTTLDYVSTEGSLREAVILGEECGHDRVVAEAATQLVAVVNPRDTEARDYFSALARAAIARIGGDARLEAWLLNNIGVGYAREGRLEAARGKFQEAVDLKIKHLGAERFDTAISEDNVAVTLAWLDRPQEGFEIARNALAMLRRATLPGGQVPFSALENMALISFRLGRLDEAEATLQEALGAALDCERCLDSVRGWLGRIAAARGNPRAAIPDLERGVRAATGLTTYDLADVEFELAKARDAVKRGDPAALELGRRARDRLAPLPDLAWLTRKVDDWLAARQSPSSAARSSAARKLSGRATPLPAMSNAVP